MKAYKLPKEFAEKWIAALRSGEYNQTKESLYNKESDGYCCLGVACKLQGIENNQMVGNGEICELSQSEDYNDDLINDYHIPEEIITGGLPSDLIYLNDGKKVNNVQVITPKTFSEIADWIEENVEFY